MPSRSVSSVSAAPPLPQRSVSALSDASVCCSEPPKQFATVTATFAPTEAWQLAVAQDSRVEVLKVEDDGWAEVCYETGKRGRVPASAIQEVKETSAAAPTTTAPEKKKGYTYSSLPALTGGPKRKIYKQPKKR